MSAQSPRTPNAARRGGGPPRLSSGEDPVKYWLSVTPALAREIDRAATASGLHRAEWMRRAMHAQIDREAGMVTTLVAAPSETVAPTLSPAQRASLLVLADFGHDGFLGRKTFDKPGTITNRVAYALRDLGYVLLIGMTRVRLTPAGRERADAERQVAA